MHEVERTRDKVKEEYVELIQSHFIRIMMEDSS